MYAKLKKFPLGTKTDQELRNKIAQMEVLQEVSLSLTGLMNIRQLLALIVEESKRIFSPDRVCLFLFRGVTEKRQIVICEGGADLKGRLYSKLKKIVAKIKQGHIDPVLVSEIFEESSECQGSTLVIPLIFSLRPIGALVLKNEEGKVNSLSSDDRLFAKAFGNQIAIAINNSNNYDLIRRKNKELRQKSEELEAVFESLQDALFVIDSEKVILRVNERWIEMTGVKKESAIGKKCFEVFKCTSFYGESLCKHCFLQDRSEEAGTSPNLMIERLDGQKVPVAVKSSAIEDSNCNKGFVVVLRDISRELVFERELRQADRLATVGKLAATWAHEIRNPLNVIRGFSELLEGSLPEEYSDAIEVIKDQVDLCNFRISQFLSFSKNDQAKKRTEPCNINSVISEYLKELSPAVLSRVDVKTDLRAKFDKIVLDGNETRQVLSNIIDNSISAMPHGGKLILSDREKGADLVLRILDSGPGISEDILGNIFDPFFTTKETGTGLGLSIVEKILVEAGGDIDIQSELGSGTKVTIRIPLSRE